MARPKSFEKDDVLKSAMNVFWNRGYQETTMEDLTTATGLQPGSLYGAFGDKEKLFEEALDHYRDTVIRRRVRILRGDGDLKTRLRKFLEDIVDQSSREDRPPGCLVTNSSFELDSFSPQNQDRIRSAMNELQTALLEAFENAPEVGGRNAHPEPGALAETTLALVNGMNVLARTGRDRDELEAIVETALHNLLPLNREVQR